MKSEEGEDDMREWKEFKLGVVAELVKKKYTPQKGDGLKYIGLEHIQEQVLRLSGVGNSDDITSDKFYFKPGDILFGKLRPYFRKVVQPKFGGVCSTDIWVVRAKNGVNQDYLYYLFANKEFVDLSNSGEAGTRMPRADWNFMSQTVWNIPEDEREQRAIASVLSSLDDKIDLLHRQNKTLEAMAETLFSQWFIEPSLNSSQKEGKAEEEREEGKLGDVADFNNGKSRPESIEGSTIPIYGGNGILGYTLRSNSEGMSIVIGRVGAYCGSLYIENRPIWITDNALSAKPKDRKYTSYLYYLLKSLNLNQMAEGSSHPLLTQTLLNAIDLTIPSDDIIAAFCSFADSILMKSFFNKHQIRTIKKLRDILLPKLMSGEVRVSL